MDARLAAAAQGRGMGRGMDASSHNMKDPRKYMEMKPQWSRPLQQAAAINGLGCLDGLALGHVAWEDHAI